MHPDVLSRLLADHALRAHRRSRAMRAERLPDRCRRAAPRASIVGRRRPKHVPPGGVAARSCARSARDRNHAEPHATSSATAAAAQAHAQPALVKVVGPTHVENVQCLVLVLVLTTTAAPLTTTLR